MKKSVSLLFVCLLAGISLQGQVHHLNFTHVSPPLPLVDAGTGFTAICGVPFTLQGSVSGGTAPYSHYWQPGSYLVDSTILNATGTITSQVTFTLTAKDALGCELSDQVMVECMVTGITEYDSREVRVYPNPCKGWLFIEGLDCAENATFMCCSSQGLCVFSKQIQQGTANVLIDLSGLRAGFYHAVILSGGRTIQHKLIIQ